MQLPGEYPQPLQRTTEIRSPVIAGLVTARLRPVTAIISGTTIAGSNVPDSSTLATIKNQSNVTLTLQFQETNDYVNGPFNASGVSVTIAPRGQATTLLYPKSNYLELKGLTGTGAVSVQLSSQIQFDAIAFDKTDARDSSGLWNANYPAWSKL